jgi:AAA domain-containing protein
MPSLNDHASSKYTKLLLIGEAGSGKTGSLASLVLAGYKLRILDFDNGLDALASVIKRSNSNLLANVEFETLRDKYTTGPAGPIVQGMPNAFTSAISLLSRWKTNSTDLGVPAEWGPEVIVVLDSLTFCADAAYNWANALNPGAKDKRQIYYTAQQAVENTLALLTGESFRANVIVISHIRYTDMPDGTKRGYPTAVGSALGPTIPAYFNSTALCQSAAGGKRSIRTVSTAMIDLKNPKSFEMAESLPIESALATFFKTVRT